MSVGRKPSSQQALAAVLSGGGEIGSLIRAPDGRAPCILVGDGDPDMRDRLYRILASAGCQVEIANDGRAAFIAAGRSPPDLVVADAALAQLHGYALLRQMRADPATSWLPIILLSAEPGDAAKREALDAGADDYLVKPFGARELLSRVGLHLAMARVGREASEAVRASERRLAEVLEAIGEAVYAIDRDERILFANRKALELWNKREEEVLGQRLLDVFPGIESGEPYRACREVLTTGEARHLEAQAPAIGNRWIGLDVHPAPQGGLVVAFRDIDERKRAEARLRESEERFRLMLEALPQAAFTIAADGNAEYYNQALRDYVGSPIGADPDSRTALQHPDDQPRLERARAAGAADGTEYTVELRIRRHDGVYRWHRVHNRPIRFDGKIEYWLGTAVDINDMRETNELLERRVAERTGELEAANRRLAAQIEDRERAEAQLRQAQRVEAVGQLTSGIAHDFNNLLTAIIGNLELLEARLGDRDEGAARLLAGAQSAAERGARLTAQLLAFSRQQQMRLEPVDLNRIVSGMSGLLQSTIGATIEIETVLAEGLWPALADASQIELVLLNLAINSRDAMPLGGSITVETANRRLGPPQRAEEPGPGDYVMVSVADRGSGIPADILDKVFDPFFTTKEVGKGSGLGLSQVLGVAQQLGGGVRIDTRPGRGTSVKVYLPRADIVEAQRPDAAAGLAAGDADATAQRGGIVLLVDDDPDVREIAAAMLSDAGHEVIEAGSGGAALEQLARAEGRIELLIADIAMPGMSGLELARAARLSRPELPILFVTGFAAGLEQQEDEIPGEILRKPFRAAELAAHVARMLGRGGERGARLGQAAS
jgi:PAS domain S-box-containing protein